MPFRRPDDSAARTMPHTVSATLRTLTALLLVAGAWLAPPTLAQNDVQRAQQMLQAANAAYREQEFERFTLQLEQALELNPASMATRYNLACGYALTGRHARALDLLQQLADARVDYGMADDPDLASLHEQPEFVALVATLKERLAPVSASRHWYTVEQWGLIPEGVAVDTATGRSFFGSMRNGEIYVIDAAGRLSRFAGIASPRGFSAIGLTVDTARGILWSIGTSTSMAADFNPEATVRSGLFGFDLASGEAAAHYPADPAVEAFNDVTIAPNGDIYLSGTVLSVLRNGSDRIEPLPAAAVLAGSNGITVSPDGATLFTSSYPVGIAAIDLASGAMRFLDRPPDTSLYGIDGLYWYRDGLVAIQNGVQPWRLLRIALNDARTAATGIRMIEFANPAMIATTGAIIGNEIRYIGQGPAPDPAPGHVAASLVANFGMTLIMAAELD